MAGTTNDQSSATRSRRAQIIEATIESIAEFGFARTTFAKIAARGGLSSTRLISYHFASKRELMNAVIDDIYQSIDQFLFDRMAIDPATRPISQRPDRPEDPESAAAELRAYITGVVAYIDKHRSRMRAIQSIFAAEHDEMPNPAVTQADPHGVVMTNLQSILRRGRRDGEFRDFDPVVIATMIQRPLEALPLLLAGRTRIDLDKYAAELATAVDLATRHPGHR
ncbi:TetR/AcrR family transcriptional regulator [Nocardia carnea]|uniref:TetR/AcrR family transcriptional regulator n=1 Tax=Nocardia carnea TaxID=37328 RepID=A0ABW7TW44_9NOCA|nr:TetR family transcriptional regulator [Nocardia carnea]